MTEKEQQSRYCDRRLARENRGRRRERLAKTASPSSSIIRRHQSAKHWWKGLKAAAATRLQSKADVGDPAAVRAMFDKAEASSAPVRRLINMRTFMKLANSGQ